jgi:CO/xanthine dehydrogenase FAD-binding subunit
LRRIEELRRIEQLPDGLRIGAGVVVARLLDDPMVAAIPLLRKAARAFGTRQVRNRGTVGGNIVSGLPDRTLLPCLLVLDASVDLQSAKSARSVPLEAFLLGPGETAIAADEILVSVTVRRVNGFQDYTMVGPRNAQFYVTASAALAVAEGTRNVKLGLGNVGPTAMRAKAAESFANGAIDWAKRSVPEPVSAKFGEIAAANCDPPDDVTSSSAYRRHAVKVMARRLLERAFTEEMPA